MRVWLGTLSGSRGIGGKPAMRLVLVGLICMLTSELAVAAPGSGASDPMGTARLKFAAFNRHDVAAIRALYSRDAVLHSPDHPALAGNLRIAATYQSLFAAVPDAKDKVESLDQSGNKVFAQYVLTGHVQGAASKPVHVRILSVYTIEGGHIVTDSTYYDRKAE